MLGAGADRGRARGNAGIKSHIDNMLTSRQETRTLQFSLVPAAPEETLVGCWWSQKGNPKQDKPPTASLEVDPSGARGRTTQGVLFRRERIVVWIRERHRNMMSMRKTSSHGRSGDEEEAHTTCVHTQENILWGEKS